MAICFPWYVWKERDLWLVLGGGEIGEYLLSVLSGGELLFARSSLHLREFVSSCLSVATKVGSSLLVFLWASLVVLVTFETSPVSWVRVSAGGLKPFRDQWLIIRRHLRFPVMVIILLIIACVLSSLLLKKGERRERLRRP